MSSATQRHDWRAGQTQLPNPPEVGPQPPLRFEGGSLGLHRCGLVTFSGPDGRHYMTEPQDVLANIDQFAEPDRSRVLFTAGVHYGVVPRLMVDPNYQVTDEDRERWEAHDDD